MRITFALGLLFLASCGTDNFGSKNDAGDASGESSTIEGGNPGDARTDAMGPPKPRLFVTVQDIQTPDSSALLVWDDPDALATARPPDITIPVSDAADLVVAKNKRLIVAGFTKVHIFDGPLALTSASKPKSLDKNAFQGLGPGDINVMELAYDPTLDLLVTVDSSTGGAMQSFKNASTMPANATSAARFGAVNDAFLHAAIGANGQLAGAKVTTSTSNFDLAQNASGAAVASNWFVIGTGTIRIAGNRLLIANSENSLATLYIYAYPVTQSMPPWLAKNQAFAANGEIANDVLMTPSFMAVSVKIAQSTTGFICIFSNPSAVTDTTQCSHKIPINDGVPFKMFERMGKLFVAVAKPPSNSSVQMFKTPLTDMTPTITFALGNAKLASGFGIVEPN